MKLTIKIETDCVLSGEQLAVSTVRGREVTLQISRRVTERDLMKVLRHQCDHVLRLLTPVTLNEEGIDIHQMYNVAQDFVINEILRDSGIK